MGWRPACVDLGRVQGVVAREDGVAVTIVVSGAVHVDSMVGMRSWCRLVPLGAIVTSRWCCPPALAVTTGVRKGSSTGWARAWMARTITTLLTTIPNILRCVFAVHRMGRFG